MYERELSVAKSIAAMAGDTMLAYFDGDQELEIKSDDTPVTVADKLINSMVIKELQKEFDDEIIGEEESTGEYGMGRKWFCDPIDGTKAFVAGTPTAMFSLGLVIDGQPVMGVVYDPFLDKLYEATVGGGSKCNGKSISVCDKPLAGEYMLVTSSPQKILEDSKTANELRNLIDEKARLFTFSGAVYKSALVATGRAVGYYETMVNAHDTAAVQVIVEEAGGHVSAIDGSRLDYSKPFRGALVTNAVAREAILRCLS